MPKPKLREPGDGGIHKWKNGGESLYSFAADLVRGRDRHDLQTVMRTTRLRLARGSMSLKKYSRKRNFKKTDEPTGVRATGAGRRRFVVQKHAASHLHYDFRLEAGGTLKSWAVPKGIPLKKGEKRLAVEVEDHPVGYIDFEGTIPKGQYGGGTVMVWDRGTYEPIGLSPEEGIESGRLHFRLDGQKLKGEWHLIRLRGRKQWLLIRAKDDMAPVSKRLEDTSALTERNMREIAGRDEEMPLGKTGLVCQIKFFRMDAGRKTSPASLSGLAGGQKARGSRARNTGMNKK